MDSRTSPPGGTNDPALPAPFGTLPVAVAVERASDGILLYANPACEILFGISPELLVGRNAGEFYVDETDRKDLRKEALAGGSTRGAELRLRRIDGSLRWVSLSMALTVVQGEPALLGVFADIHRRKESEESLRESEERFRTISEAAPIPITITHRDGPVLYVNEAAERLFRIRRDQAIGQDATSFYADPSRRALLKEALLKQGVLVGQELQFRRADGSFFWALVNFRLMTFGDAPALMGSFVDISERKQAEEVLREKRNAQLIKMNALLEEEIRERQQAEEVLRVLVEGTATVTGKPFFDSLVRHLSSALGMKYAAVVDFTPGAPDRARLLSFWNGAGVEGPLERGLSGTPCQRVLSGKAVTHAEGVQGIYPHDALLAKLHAVCYLGVPIQGKSGVVGCLSVLDIKPAAQVDRKVAVLKIFAARAGAELERHLAEVALRESEERWRSLVTHAPDFILTIDREGRILSINRTLPELSADKIIGVSALDFCDPRGKELVQSVLHRIFQKRESTTHEVPALGPNGSTAWYLTRGAPVIVGDQVVAGVIIATDITGRRQADEDRQRAVEETSRAYHQLQEAQSQLIRSEKLASIGMLVSGVAHELNNPLNVMSGNLELLGQAFKILLPLSAKTARKTRSEDASRLIPKVRGMIRDASKAAGQARRIIEEFRNFARDTRAAEVVSLKDCAEDAIVLFARQLRPGIRLRKKFAKVPLIHGFRGQLSQVVFNLLSNAADAIEKSGVITIRTSVKKSAVCLEVADTGKGMDEAVRRKVFEPFFSTKPPGRGLGLGLSISAMIIQNHRGTISVRSRPGRGTTFMIELPVPEVPGDR